MKGMKCRCGFASVSQKAKCPRCGNQMKPAEWPDEGKVLSFTALHAVPEGLSDRYNLVLVEVARKGPKVICWTPRELDEEEEVSVIDRDGKLFCFPRTTHE
jgi:uncharacterized OB-fold protein